MNIGITIHSISVNPEKLLTTPIALAGQIESVSIHTLHFLFHMPYNPANQFAHHSTIPNANPPKTDTTIPAITLPPLSQLE